MAKKETVKFNPENWIRDEAEIIIDRNAMEFEINGYHFRLIGGSILGENDGDEALGHYDIFLVNDNGTQEEYKTGSVSKWGNKKIWEAHNWNYELMRDSEDLFLAAGKLVSNLY